MSAIGKQSHRAPAWLAILATFFILNLSLPSFCAAPPACLAPPPDAVSWWPNESGAVDVLSTNNGTILGGVSTGAGKVGSALQFNGIDGYVVIPATPSLNVQSFTFEGWIYPADVETRRSIIEYTQGGVLTGAHIALGTRGSLSPAPGAIYANVRGADFSEHVLASPENTLRKSEWQHIALTYDQTTGLSRLFVNGTIVSSANFGSFTPRTSLPLYLGTRPRESSDYNGAPPFAGYIDELTLYNRALSPEDISAIYHADSAGKCSGPSITPGTLPEAYLASTYRAALNGSRGVPPYTFVLSSGTLPPGLTLTSEGVISGTPTLSGLFAFAVSLTDANGAGSTREYEIAVPLCAPIPTGLISWWPANGSGKDLGDTNDLQLVDVSFSPHGRAQSFQLNGTTSFAFAQASPSFANVSSFSLEAWIFPTDLAVRRPIFDFSSPSGPLGVHVWISTSSNAGLLPGALFANVRDVSGQDHVLTTREGALKQGVWQHIALTYDQSNGSATLYVDGKVALSQTVGRVNPNLSLPLYVGYRFPGNAFYNGAPPFAGAIDEIALYDRPLSATEVNALYTSAGEGKCLGTLWARSVRSSIALTWLSAATNIVLESSPALLPASWSAVPDSPVATRSGRRQGLTRPATNSTEFFHLK